MRALLFASLLVFPGCATLNPFATPEPPPQYCFQHLGIWKCEASPGLAYLQNPGAM